MKDFEFVQLARAYMTNMIAFHDVPLDVYTKSKRPAGSKSNKKMELDAFFVVVDDSQNMSGMQKMDALLETFCQEHLPSVSLMAYRKMLSFVRAHEGGIYELPFKDAYNALGSYLEDRQRLEVLEQTVTELGWKLKEMSEPCYPI